MPNQTSDYENSSDDDRRAVDSDSSLDIDPNSAAPTPRPGERIGTALTLGPSPFFVESRLERSTSPDTSKPECVCSVHCRCCHKGSKVVQSVLDRERIKAERREQRAQMEQKEEMKIKEERKLLRWMRGYFYLGCFGLPLVHFMAVVYFIPELRNKHDSNFRIQQYCYMALIVGSIESLLWVAWFVLFQLFHDNENLKWMQRLNILNLDYNITCMA